MMTDSGLVFETVLAFLEMMHQLLNDPELNNACSINRIDPVRDFGIKKVL
jgi:hypothetical protein